MNEILLTERELKQINQIFGGCETTTKSFVLREPDEGNGIGRCLYMSVMDEEYGRNKEIIYTISDESDW